MEILLYSLMAAYTLISLYNFFAKKDRFNVSTFITVGITLPLFLYFLKWSGLIVDNPVSAFYYIFISFYAIAIAFDLLTKSKRYASKTAKSFNWLESITIKNGKLIVIISIFYILLYLLENYIGTGYLIPTMHGIDVHTYSAPIISLITRNNYIFLILPTIQFLKRRKVIDLIQIVLILFIPFFTRAARITVIISLVEILCLYFFLNTKKKRTIILSILIVIIGIAFLGFNDYRTNKYNNVSNYSYSNEIQYKGPNVLKSSVAAYYGYFPLSFNNLNVNLKYKQYDYNFVGLNTFYDLYYGVFQLDTFFGVDSLKAEKSRVIVTRAATVPTAFYNYFYDFGPLVGIPIIINFLFFFVLKKKMYDKFLYPLLYFHYIPTFCFLSFQNVFFAAQMIYGVILIIILYKCFIVESKKDDK